MTTVTIVNGSRTRCPRTTVWPSMFLNVTAYAVVVTSYIAITRWRSTDEFPSMTNDLLLSFGSGYVVFLLSLFSILLAPKVQVYPDEPRRFGGARIAVVAASVVSVLGAMILFGMGLFMLLAIALSGRG